MKVDTTILRVAIHVSHHPCKKINTGPIFGIPSSVANRATMVLMNSMREYGRQQQRAKRDTITLFRIEDMADSESRTSLIDCRCCIKTFTGPAMKQCVFCEKSTCRDCLEECFSCHQMFCTFCSIKNYSRSDPFSFCMTCYAHHNSPL